MSSMLLFSIKNSIYRSESRGNLYSSDSISRKFRNGVSRKRQVVQRKGESPKPNKASKSRLVQVIKIIIILNILFRNCLVSIQIIAK